MAQGGEDGPNGPSLQPLRKTLGINDADWQATKKIWDCGGMMLLAFSLIAPRKKLHKAAKRPGEVPPKMAVGKPQLNPNLNSSRKERHAISPRMGVVGTSIYSLKSLKMPQIQGGACERMGVLWTFHMI